MFLLFIWAFFNLVSIILLFLLANVDILAQFEYFFFYLIIIEIKVFL
jgi:hypothetical protein